jgi:putative transposase
MPNHFHFLVRQNIDSGISKFMSNFENSYTKYFNIKNSRIGPLLQGPFKAVKIDSEEQLLHVSRYIHLNPFSSALVKNIDDLINYEWSSFSEYFGLNKYKLCQRGNIFSTFKNIETYRLFVFDQADYQKCLEEIKHLILE